MIEQKRLPFDDEAPAVPLDQMLEWGRRGTVGPIHEKALPPSVRAALELARAERPDRRLTCIAFHTRYDGQEVTRMGPEGELSEHERLLMLFLVTSEVTREGVTVVAHVLVTQMDQAF